MSASKPALNTKIPNGILESFTAEAAKETASYDHSRALEVVDKIDGSRFNEIARAMGIEGNFPADSKDAFKLALQQKFTAFSRPKGREDIYSRIISELFPNGIPENPEQGTARTIYLAGPFGIDRFAKLKEIMSPDINPENEDKGQLFFQSLYKKSHVSIDFKAIINQLPEFQENMDKLVKAGIPANLSRELAHAVIRAEASGIAIAAANLAKSKNMTIFSGDSLVTIPPEQMTPEYMSRIAKSNEGRQVIIYGMINSKLDINSSTGKMRYHVDSIDRSLSNFSKLLESFPGRVVDVNFVPAKENEKPKQPPIILDSKYVRKLEVKETFTGKVVLNGMKEQLKAAESGKELPAKPSISL